MNPSTLQKLMDGDIKTNMPQARFQIIMHWVVMVMGAVFCTWGFLLLVGIPLLLYGFFMHRLWMRIWKDRGYQSKVLLPIKIAALVIGAGIRLYAAFYAGL